MDDSRRQCGVAMLERGSAGMAIQATLSDAHTLAAGLASSHRPVAFYRCQAPAVLQNVRSVKSLRSETSGAVRAG